MFKEIQYLDFVISKGETKNDLVGKYDYVEVLCWDMGEV